MFEVYTNCGGYIFHDRYFDDRADAEEYCLACAEYACFERYCLEGYRGISWGCPNTLIHMGYHYVREVKSKR